MEEKQNDSDERLVSTPRCSTESPRRFLLTLAFACWFGGFTFYALVVIPTAHHVLGNNRDVGFITQEVTNWLNWVGVLWLIIALWNAVVAKRTRSSILKRLLKSTWIIMVVTQAGLFATHPFMDQLLDGGTRAIANFTRFEHLHDLYETIITIQWLASLVYLWCAIAEWRQQDRKML
jgi:hypothetical protein